MLAFIRGAAALLALTLIGFGLVTSDEVSDVRWLLLLGGAWLLLLFATRIPLPPTLPTFNRSVVRTALVVTTVFVVISAQLVRIQVVQSDETYYRTATAPDGEVIANPRIGGIGLDVERGEIYDRDGELIAGTEREDGQYVRFYPDPATAYVAGYYSPLLYGASGLEASYNRELLGQAANNPFERELNNLLHRPQEGSDLNLTLNADLQRAATEMLGGNTGSVVVLDVQTGAVIVMASNPGYDPNELFTSSPSQNDEATDYWETLIDDPQTPLVLRSTLGLYTPGSTFKTVTAATAIQEGYAAPDDIYEDDGQITIDGRVLVENNRPDETRDQWTLAEGLAWSLNVVFAQIGLEIGATDFWESAQRFGFGASIPFDLPVSESQLASSRDFLSDANALADTAFGQGQIQVTPLHMAMIAATFANDGDMMEPYLVDSITDSHGNVSRAHEPDVWREPIDADTAQALEEMMINTVENGSAQQAITPGYTIGGKTGTAETGDGSVHSWFIAFICDPEPRYAVAVVLEEGGGLTSAINIARDMLVATMRSGRDDE